MKTISIICMLLIGLNAYAKDEKLSCLRDAYLDYTKKVSTYWDLKGSEFKKISPELYKDFSHLITEQKNHNRMQEITVEYLIEAHPEELNLSGNVYNLVPRYKHYAQKIYRELRTRPEFNQLYLGIESYKKENMMPSYEKLKMASEIVAKTDDIPAVKEAMSIAIKKSEVMISSLACGS